MYWKGVLASQKVPYLALSTCLAVPLAFSYQRVPLAVVACQQLQPSLNGASNRDSALRRIGLSDLMRSAIERNGVLC